MVYQEFDGREINHFLIGFICLLVISSESPECIQPCEDSFDHPSERLRGEVLCTVGGVADLNLYVEICLYLIGHLSSVTPVNEYLLKGGSEEGSLLTKRMGRSGIMTRCIVNPPSQYKAIAVHNDTALDVFDLLVGIIPVVTHSVAPLDVLRVKCSHAQGIILFMALPDSHDYLLYKALDTSLLPPLPEELVDGLPFREILREHTPLTSVDQQVKDGFKGGPQGIFPMAAIILKEYFVYIRLLILSQMCLIEVYLMHMNTFFSYQHSG